MTQDEAFKVLTMGKNVFLTGAAGSGKTHLLNTYIAWLRARGIDPAITASTGIAATHMGGQTIHSWSGIGIKNALSEYDLDFIEQNEKLVKRFQKTRVLIIDEISMLSAQTLTMVNQAIQAALQTHEPFGGMQVILCGDFFQLPPITRESREVQFAFQSEVWKELRLNTCYLSQQFRQNDSKLITLLNGIRGGDMSNALHNLLKERIGLVPPKEIPHLYTHNVNVDELNNERLAALTEHSHIFKMKSKGSKARVEALKKGLLVPEVLTLKKGAVVMFVKNHPYGSYVNGTLGTVTGISKQNPVVTTHDGVVLEVEPEAWRIEDGNKVLAEVTQIPLRLAWAVTVHKSQGITLDAAYIDLTKTFVEGQGYVALSRVRTFEGLYLKGVNEYAFARHPAVAHMQEVFQKASENTQRRLAKTDERRIKEVSEEFVVRVGGHPPDPTKKLEEIKKVEKLSTYDQTIALLKKKADIHGIATMRKLSEGTVLSHLEKLLEKKRITRKDLKHIRKNAAIEDEVFEKIATAFAKKKTWSLTPVRTELKDAYTFEELRFARLFLRPWGTE
jgi:ATP-dependent DNA helicase PIF1